MNRRVLIIVSCALILSASASYLVYKAVSARVITGKPAKVAQLVVAARDLVPGTLVHDADLKMAGWEGPLPRGAILQREDLVNRGVGSAIYEGEPLTEKRLSPKGSGGGLAATIPTGMRACAIKVNDVVGVAGFVVAGMRVDVLIAGIPPGGNLSNGPEVRTLLQNIEVLSAGTNFQKNQEGKPEQAQVVNLLVTPAQAEILSLASNETRIQLVLRNPMDTQIARPPGTIMSDLFRGASATAQSGGSYNLSAQRHPASPVIAAPVIVSSQYTIEVSNGPVHTQAKFSRLPGTQ